MLTERDVFTSVSVLDWHEKSVEIAVVTTRPVKDTEGNPFLVVVVPVLPLVGCRKRGRKQF